MANEFRVKNGLIVHDGTAVSGVSPNANADNIVVDASGDSGMTIFSGASSTGNIFFGDGDSATQGQILYAHGSNSMRLVTAGSERVRIDSSGNVGIGATSPSTKLHVKVADDTTHAATNLISDYEILVHNHSVTTNSFSGIAFISSTEVDDDSIGASIAGVRDTAAGATAGNHDTNLVFSTNDAGDDANTERMRITHDGLVGIGTSDPSTALDVAGDLSFSGSAARTIHGGAYNPLTIYGNSDGTATSTTNNVVTRSTAAAIDFDVNASQQLAMRIKDNKDVDVYGVLSGPGIAKGAYGANSFNFGATGDTNSDGTVNAADDWYEVFRWTPNATMSSTSSNQYRNFAARFNCTGRGNARVNFDIYVRGEYGVQDSNGWWAKEFIIDGLEETTDDDGNASPDADSIFLMVYNAGTSLSMPYASLYMRRDEDWELRTCNLISMFTNCVFEFKDSNVGETTPTNDGETGSADLSPSIRRKLLVDENNQLINGVGATGIYFDDTNDRLGIGTSSPQSLLDVRGAAGAPGTLTLSTAETTVVDGDKLGRIDFNAPSEADGTDAVAIGASIWAEADDTFAADNNRTELVFATGASEAAVEEMRLTWDGKLGIGTPTPTRALDVNGDIVVRGRNILDDGGSSAISFDGSGNTTIDGTLTVSGSTATVNGSNILVAGAQTEITTDFSTSRKVGRDADNLIDFTTDDEITFRAATYDVGVLSANKMLLHSDGSPSSNGTPAFEVFTWDNSDTDGETTNATRVSIKAKHTNLNTFGMILKSEITVNTAAHAGFGAEALTTNGPIHFEGHDDTYGFWGPINAPVSGQMGALLIAKTNYHNEYTASGNVLPQSQLEVRSPAGGPGTLTLSTEETTVVDGDQLGRIDFNAPKEADGGDAVAIAASIYAEADATFSSTVNTTDLVFATATDAAASEAMRIKGDKTITTQSNLTVGGNLVINGTTTTVDTATLAVEDPLIILASGNDAADTVDIGFYGLYDTTGSQDLYAGLFRDADDGKFHLFKDLQDAPTTTVSKTGTGYAVATLVANIEGNLTGTIQTAAQTNITSVGALNGGSITSGFGSIDNGTSGIRSNNITAETAFLPDAADGATLGSATLEFSDLYLADGAQILFGNDQDITITHVADTGLRMEDNHQLIFGTDSDLKIYHDGSNSYIDEEGTGSLIINSSQVALKGGADAAENMATFIDNGAVTLYHNNSAKFATTSTGVEVTGLMQATTKSFDIEHPTKKDMRLRYGALEGPEYGVYHRGVGKSRVVDLPDYWTGLVDEDSITVQLTPRGGFQSLYVSKIEGNRVYVDSDHGEPLDFYFNVYGERKDVDKLVVEY